MGKVMPSFLRALHWTAGGAFCWPLPLLLRCDVLMVMVFWWCHCYCCSYLWYSVLIDDDWLYTDACWLHYSAICVTLPLMTTLTTLLSTVTIVIQWYSVDWKSDTEQAKLGGWLFYYSGDYSDTLFWPLLMEVHSDVLFWAGWCRCSEYSLLEWADPCLHSVMSVILTTSDCWPGPFCVTCSLLRLLMGITRPLFLVRYDLFWWFWCIVDAFVITVVPDDDGTVILEYLLRWLFGHSVHCSVFVTICCWVWVHLTGYLF